VEASTRMKLPAALARTLNCSSSERLVKIVVTRSFQRQACAKYRSSGLAK